MTVDCSIKSLLLVPGTEVAYFKHLRALFNSIDFRHSLSYVIYVYAHIYVFCILASI